MGRLVRPACAVFAVLALAACNRALPPNVTPPDVKPSAEAAATPVASVTRTKEK